MLRRYAVPPRGEEKLPAGWRPLFTCAQVPWAELVPRWWAVGERYRATVGLLLSERAAYVEQQVLGAVGAAETFHRDLTQSEEGREPVPPEVFEAVRKAALDAAPKEYRTRFRDRFARNEPTLKERLLDLVGRMPEGTVDRWLPDPGRWAREAVTSRDTVAHTGTGGAGPEVLHAVAVVTSAVVTLAVLRELGVPDEHLRVLSDGHARFTSARFLAERQLT